MFALEPKKDGEKYFIKFTGAKTAEYDGNPADAVIRLKSTVPIYENLKHKNLIEYISSREIGNGFAMILSGQTASVWEGCTRNRTADLCHYPMRLN